MFWLPLRPDPRARNLYGSSEAEEQYYCNFGLDPEHQRIIDEGGLRVSGVDRDGEARILELPKNPFYVATLFVPQMKSTRENPHPLVTGFLEAALDKRRAAGACGWRSPIYWRLI